MGLLTRCHIAGTTTKQSLEMGMIMPPENKRMDEFGMDEFGTASRNITAIPNCGANMPVIGWGCIYSITV